MPYTLEEQETILRFDVLTNTWDCYSASLVYIRQLQKYADKYDCIPKYTSEGCIRVTLPKRAIKFCNPPTPVQIANGVRLAKKRNKGNTSNNLGEGSM